MRRSALGSPPRWRTCFTCPLASGVCVVQISAFMHAYRLRSRPVRRGVQDNALAHDTTVTSKPGGTKVGVQWGEATPAVACALESRHSGFVSHGLGRLLMVANALPLWPSITNISRTQGSQAWIRGIGSHLVRPESESMCPNLIGCGVCVDTFPHTTLVAASVCQPASDASACRQTHLAAPIAIWVVIPSPTRLAVNIIARGVDEAKEASLAESLLAVVVNHWPSLVCVCVVCASQFGL